MSGSYLSWSLLCPWIVAIGLVVFHGMAGCLVFVVLVGVTLGRPLLEIWLAVSWNVVWVLILGILLLLGPRLNIGDADDIALEMSDTPDICTDGSREDFSAPELAFDGAVWSVAEEDGDARLERCRAFMPVPGVMHTVQRAEFWCAILSLQSYWPCHLGIDNLNVARSIGRLLDRGCLIKPLPLVKDGDEDVAEVCLLYILNTVHFLRTELLLRWLHPTRAFRKTYS